jgi:hypothetical protein
MLVNQVYGGVAEDPRTRRVLLLRNLVLCSVLSGSYILGWLNVIEGVRERAH